ncbi:MAG: hypothetical protein R2853_13445 [Thermomicrobiales bacterium]
MAPAWFPDAAAIGSCGRLRWFEGFRPLLCSTVDGIITGWGGGTATSSERALAETFLAGRADPDPALSRVGTASGLARLADMGFRGKDCQARWQAFYGAIVRCSPQIHAKAVWSRPEHRALARLAARIGLHHTCIWLNHQQNQPNLAIANLIARLRCPHPRLAAPPEPRGQERDLLQVRAGATPRISPGCHARNRDRGMPRHGNAVTRRGRGLPQPMPHGWCASSRRNMAPACH